MSDKFIGRGDESLRDDYIDFINYVFGFDGKGENFPDLLPKMFSAEDRPAENAYFVKCDGKIKAALATYDHEMNYAGEVLKCRGIGNVAVHPFCRSRGYMKELMDLAVSDMIRDGTDLSFLGGKRQRYNYFSYEKTGTAYSFNFTADNMRHNFLSGKIPYTPFEIREVGREDGEALDYIYGLEKGNLLDPMRDRSRLFDILSSWHSDILLFTRGGENFGYCTADGNRIKEIMLGDKKNMLDATASAFEYVGKKTSQNYLRIMLPMFETSYIRDLYGVCESCSLSANEVNCSVFNFRKVVDACMRLKSRYEELPEGGVTLLIHGIKGDEKFRIEIRNGHIETEDDDTDYVDYELGHLEAINFLFSPLYPERKDMSYFNRLLFPLPLWIYKTDAV